MVAGCVIGSCLSSPVAKRGEGEGIAKCKALCKLCDCIGFYCGEECICECNNKNDESELSTHCLYKKTLKMMKILLFIPI